jgi:hypothetical protein
MRLVKSIFSNLYVKDEPAYNNPANERDEVQDFLTDDVSHVGWEATVGGAGASVDLGNAHSDNNHDGIVELSSGTTGAGFAVIHKSNSAATGFILGGGRRFFETLVRIDDLSIAAQEYVLHLGFGGTNDGSEHDDGVYFTYDRTVNVNWLLKAADGGVITAIDSGVAVATGGWVKLRTEVSADGTSVEYFINDVSVGNIGVNVPVTNIIRPVLLICKTNGNTARLLHVDYFKEKVVYSTSR